MLILNDGLDAVVPFETDCLVSSPYKEAEGLSLAVKDLKEMTISV